MPASNIQPLPEVRMPPPSAQVAAMDGIGNFKITLMVQMYKHVLITIHANRTTITSPIHLILNFHSLATLMMSLDHHINLSNVAETSWRIREYVWLAFRR